MRTGAVWDDVRPPKIYFSKKNPEKVCRFEKSRYLCSPFRLNEWETVQKTTSSLTTLGEQRGKSIRSKVEKTDQNFLSNEAIRKSFRIDSSLRICNFTIEARKEFELESAGPGGLDGRKIHKRERGEGRTGDALASGGEEGRGKLRKCAGTGKHGLIRARPNGATRRAEGPSPGASLGRTGGTETS